MVQGTWGPTGKPAALAEISSSSCCALPVFAHTLACQDKSGDAPWGCFLLAKAPTVFQGHFQAASLGCFREAAMLPFFPPSWGSDFGCTAKGRSTGSSMLLKSCAKGGMEAEQQDPRKRGGSHLAWSSLCSLERGWDTASCLARTTTMFL